MHTPLNFIYELCKNWECLLFTNFKAWLNIIQLHSSIVAVLRYHPHYLPLNIIQLHFLISLFWMILVCVGLKNPLAWFLDSSNFF